MCRNLAVNRRLDVKCSKCIYWAVLIKDIIKIEYCRCGLLGVPRQTDELNDLQLLCEPRQHSGSCRCSVTRVYALSCITSPPPDSESEGSAHLDRVQASKRTRLPAFVRFGYRGSS